MPVPKAYVKLIGIIQKRKYALDSTGRGRKATMAQGAESKEKATLKGRRLATAAV